MASSSSKCRSLFSSCVRNGKHTSFRRLSTAPSPLASHKLLFTNQAVSQGDPGYPLSGQSFAQAAASGSSGIIFTPRSIALHKFSTDSTENKDKADTTEEETPMSESERKLTEENESLKSQHADLMDKYRRSIAESDNMRKRLTKQIDDAKVFGIQSFCKDLLAVADVLNKASADVTEEIVAKENSSYLKDVVEGVRLTEAQLQQGRNNAVFRRHGLEKMDALGQKFDPNLHEALFQVPAPDKEPNTVVDVQTVGYVLHGRTIRPAKVGVSRK